MKYLLLAIQLLLLTSAYAQDETVLLTQLLKEENDAIEAIALYPSEQRTAILTASSHPEILVRLDQMQQRTQESFRKLIVGLDRNNQEKIYDLSRYPDLIVKITSDGERKSKKEMDALLTEYNEQTQNNAIYLNKEHFNILAGIRDLQLTNQLTYEAILRPYSEQTRRAFQELLNLPEVLGILNENMNATVLIGDIYVKDPTLVNTKLDSVASVLAEKQAKDISDWQEGLQNDTAALAEYEAASKQFAHDNNYGQDYSGNVYVTEINNYTYWNPYPYWFGYPWWYDYHYWYPYPWWYHTGYYYHNGTIVFIGMPSYYFVHWHFHHNHYHHFYHYPHLTDYCITYYNHHRESYTSLSEVRDWENSSKSRLPNNWMDADKKRPDRIREYGQFGIDYQTTVNSGQPNLTAGEYLQQNQARYPSLKPLLNSSKQPLEISTIGADDHETVVKPIKKIPEVQIHKEKSPVNSKDKAVDYHRDKWQRVPTTQPKNPDPSPKKPAKNPVKTPTKTPEKQPVKTPKPSKPAKEIRRK